VESAPSIRGEEHTLEPYSILLDIRFLLGVAMDVDRVDATSVLHLSAEERALFLVRLLESDPATPCHLGPAPLVTSIG
jgi:hypothetical protein